jgi:hypothetical protein
MANVKDTIANWPMSNDELREWFSSDNIPITDLAKMWIQMDQNQTTRTEIELLAKNPQATQELEHRLRNRIQFGTAGISLINK